MYTLEAHGYANGDHRMNEFGSWGMLCSLHVNEWAVGVFSLSAIGIYVLRVGPLRITLTRKVRY